MVKYYKETMLSYCLMCKQNTESNVLYVAVKNQNLLNSNKQKGY